MDFLETLWDFIKFMGVAILGVGLIILAIVVAVCLISSMSPSFKTWLETPSEHEQLVSSCMADGHKDWECESWLKQPKSDAVYYPMPMVTPMVIR